MSAIRWSCSSCRLHTSTRLKRCVTHASKRAISSNSRAFQISEEVRQAIAEQRPVVALESTIYTHGLPYPDNLTLAARLESLIRVNGGVPATIGILHGVARVGLAADELVRLVDTSKTGDTLKVSRRDLGFALGLRGSNYERYNGGTTVAGTMILAHLAGIKVFATGGLGGVHRGVEQTMDVSADLTELGRTPVAVISSGCKSFLDIPKTLEYLETQGVSVATFADGRTGNVDFPAFWSRESGVRAPRVLRDEMDAARVILANDALELQSGLHFANPIPEQHSIPLEQMESAVSQALQEAKTAGATGAASTPYILAKIRDLTGSQSLTANKALVEANVVRGTKVAVALAELRRNESYDTIDEQFAGATVIGPAAANFSRDGTSKAISGAPDDGNPETQMRTWTDPTLDEDGIDLFVAGSLAVDLACDYHASTGSSSPEAPEMHTSNPAKIAQSLGGVGHNVARAAHLLGANVRLCSALGNDIAGAAAAEAFSGDRRMMSDLGLKTLPNSRTAQYVAVNNTNKDLVLAMADMSILEPDAEGGAEDEITPTLTDFWLPQLRSQQPTHLVLDANWTSPSLARWLAASTALPQPPLTLFEPVSNAKSTRLFAVPGYLYHLTTFPHPSVHLSTPNESELAAMYTAATAAELFDSGEWWRVVNAMGIPSSGAGPALTLATTPALVDAGIPQRALQLLPFIPILCVKLGARGVLLAQILAAGDARLEARESAPYILSRCTVGAEDSVGVGGVYLRLFPAVEDVKPEEVVSVNGVGDTFAGTLMAGLVKRGTGARVEDLVDVAQRAAVLTLKSREAVSPDLITLREFL